jgi:hypothetical protein
VKIGAWIHGGGGISLDDQIALAAENGLQSIRSYGLAYAEQVAPALRRHGLSLLAGIGVESEALLCDWRSQVRLDEVARYHELSIPLDAICAGNELREGGDAADKKRFTARLSFGLANVLSSYRRWLDDHGYPTPLTYAMEGIVFDEEGTFYEWLWPLIDACDIVSLNAYPMGHEAWFTFGAFEESRRFLQDPRARHDRLVLFELRLRRALQQLEQAGKPVFLSETGFPSATGYHLEGDRLVVPESDNERYGQAMREFAALLGQVNADYERRIRALYFYEWRDNLYHDKIWNVEQSPIHVGFGLCDPTGVLKFDLGKLVDLLQGS